MKKIIFLAPYPTDKNIKDGMVSRIKAIDGFFENMERSYLSISILKNRKKNIFTDKYATVYELNIFLHFFSILKLLKSVDIIYSHSIYSSSRIWYLFPFLKNELILDVHGVVPEENKFYTGSYINYLYYSLIELVVFRNAKKIICVTTTMKVYYENKYPKNLVEYIVYSIMPPNLRDIDADELKKMKNKSSKIEIIYSGGIQGWQNIDLMLEIVSGTTLENINFTFLVNDIEAFNSILLNYNLDSEKLKVISKFPDELWEDYSKADYAFILRNDDIVNKVANPTKMIEYLNYGIIPIVLSEKIGDFDTYKYDFIKYDSMSIISKPQKPSFNNIDIVKKLYNQNTQTDIYNWIIN